MRKNNLDVPKPAITRLRCAIYTRKSTEEGLDQEFNSLDAQREAAEAFIQSQRREGWIALPELYDDGGFTSANIDRPALNRRSVEFLLRAEFPFRTGSRRSTRNLTTGAGEIPSFFICA
jgi:hypothetical protein